MAIEALVPITLNATLTAPAPEWRVGAECWIEGKHPAVLVALAEPGLWWVRPDGGRMQVRLPSVVLMREPLARA
jgi:hypothetical protein